MMRLVGRCCVLLIALGLYFTGRLDTQPLTPGGFFRSFTPMHLLWGLWVLDMFAQLIPVKRDLALGSKKLFVQYFKPTNIRKNAQSLKDYILTTTRMAYKILLLWALLLAVLGGLHRLGILKDVHLFLISVLFYVCDLICVLIWCPFRLLLKNRCCTTCRIFNWDHLMMFTPMLFIRSFYSWSLLVMSVAVWCAWETSILLHPERFWWQSNENLQCAQCTDKLCTQYCHKLRAG